MFGKFDVQPQVEESYNLSQYCTCSHGITCDLCDWVDSTLVDSANEEFDLALLEEKNHAF